MAIEISQNSDNNSRNFIITVEFQAIDSMPQKNGPKKSIIESKIKIEIEHK